MRRLAPFLLALVLAAPAGATARLPSPGRATFERTAVEGVARARVAWWDARRSWYDERLDRTWRPTEPLVRLWSAFPLFETLDALALERPTPQRLAAVRAFAAGAERYWNPAVGAFAYNRGTVIADVDTFFDDNGWWAIAFLDAYRATGDARWLHDSERAWDVIVRRGWDARAGGTWWDTRHRHKTSEPLAAAIYVGVGLYRATRDPAYLATARRFLAYADTALRDPATGLYGRSATDGTVMDYVEGMMIGAELELCSLPDGAAHCARAERLASASAAAFPHDWNPAADAIYLRFVLDLYRRDGDPRWYALAEGAAARAYANARTPGGLFLRGWDGSRTRGGLLRDEAATLSLFAWLAAAPPPARPA